MRIFGRKARLNAFLTEDKVMALSMIPLFIRMALIHVDDLADFFVRVAEKSSVLGGKIFDIVTGTSESVEEVLKKTAEVSGAQSWEFRKPANCKCTCRLFLSIVRLTCRILVYEEALTTTSLIRPYLARTLLGWEPRKESFVDGLDVYFAAWRAAVGK